MIRKPVLFWISILLVSGFLCLPSCSTEDPTTGILNITVLDTWGFPVAFEQVYLATSHQNLKEGIYVSSGWTNEFGQIAFYGLIPIVYWYDTEHWEDYGANQVYAGIEDYVFLWVNTPAN